MFVSVILPVFNGEKYIEQSLDSVINQTVKPDEIIIINDASTDRTEEIIKGKEQEFRKNGIDFIYIKNDKNCGIGWNRKKGVSRSGGDYICFISHDDIWRPEFIETMKKFAEKHKGEILYCAQEIIDSEGKTKATAGWKDYENYVDFVMSVISAARNYKMFINFSGVFIPREVFNKVKFRREDRIGEDFSFLLESVIIHKIPYRYVPHILIKYRESKDMTTMSVGMSKVIENDRKIFKRINKMAKKEVF
jgi:glycosyltransferase involved in cell wall biosynthesis